MSGPAGHWRFNCVSGIRVFPRIITGRRSQRYPLPQRRYRSAIQLSQELLIRVSTIYNVFYLLRYAVYAVAFPDQRVPVRFSIRSSSKFRSL